MAAASSAIAAKTAPTLAVWSAHHSAQKCITCDPQVPRYLQLVTQRIPTRWRTVAIYFTSSTGCDPCLGPVGGAALDSYLGEYSCPQAEASNPQPPAQEAVVPRSATVCSNVVSTFITERYVVHTYQSCFVHNHICIHFKQQRPFCRRERLNKAGITTKYISAYPFDLMFI